MTKTGKSVDGKIVVLVPAGRGGGFLEEGAISPLPIARQASSYLNPWGEQVPTHTSLKHPNPLTHHSTNPHPLASLNQPLATQNQPLLT